MNTSYNQVNFLSVNGATLCKVQWFIQQIGVTYFISSLQCNHLYVEMEHDDKNGNNSRICNIDGVSISRKLRKYYTILF